MNQAPLPIQTDPEPLIAELRRMGVEVGSGPGKKFRCPFHDDHGKDANIHHDKDGVWRVHCFSAKCQRKEDIVGLIAYNRGKTYREVFRELAGVSVAPTTNRVKPPRVFATIEEAVGVYRKNGTKVTTYPYANPDTGEIDLCVVRIEHDGQAKTFRQITPGPGGYYLRGPEGNAPLCNRKAILDSDTVVVVEGEKDVATLRSMGVVATTSPMGAGNAHKADWSPLAGKRVVIWPDNDESGMKYCEAVQAAVKGLAESVRVVDVEGLGLPKGGDVTDLVGQYRKDGMPDQLLYQTVMDIIGDSKRAGASSEIAAYYDDIESGKLNIIDLPDAPVLQKQTRLTMPGKVTVICGDPGSSKSYWMIQLACQWVKAGVPIAVYHLEDENKDHCMRALRQLTGHHGVDDPEFIKSGPENAKIVRDLLREHADFLDRLGESFTVEGDQNVTLNELADWVEQQSAKGCRVIIIDPVTLASAGEKRFLADQKFMMRVKHCARVNGFSLILVTHPKAGSKGRASLENLAGGQVYQRSAHTVIWLMRHEGDAEVFVSGLYGDTSSLTEIKPVSRACIICKSRLGPGSGKMIGYKLRSDTLTFEELGIIKRRPKAGKVEHAA